MTKDEMIKNAFMTLAKSAKTEAERDAFIVIHVLVKNLMEDVQKLVENTRR